MTRRHGIISSTYDNLILDSGAIYTGFTSLASPGQLLGATRGGATFKRVPKYVDTPYEGVPGQVKGQKHLVGVAASLDVNIIVFDSTNVLKAIPSAQLGSYSGGFYPITGAEWDASGVHTLTNIAIVAEHTGIYGPVIIILDNPLAEKDFTFNFKDKEEVVSKWVFSAYYDESVGFSTPPWTILWPGPAP